MLLIRALRLRYKISLDELAQSVDISHQLISDLELRKRAASPGEQRLLEQAFKKVIETRTKKNERLAEEFSAGRSSLLSEMEETK